MARSYGQYCGLARALDVVGDRWTLLIVRQLLVAPARYRELQDGLPGVATNLLADRLRDLEAAGVVERRLAGSGNAVEYALTAWGAGLREPVEGLIRWSAPLMARGPEGDGFRPEWLALALPALLRGRARRAVGFDVGVLLQVRTSKAGVTVGPHDGRELAAILRAGPAVVLGLAAGGLTLDEARALVTIEGDESAIRALLG